MFSSLSPSNQGLAMLRALLTAQDKQLEKQKSSGISQVFLLRQTRTRGQVPVSLVTS